MRREFRENLERTRRPDASILKKERDAMAVELVRAGHSHKTVAEKLR
jgi:hypothetical protein